MFCHKCGQKREGKDSFCAQCGIRLDTNKGVSFLSPSVKLLLAISAGLLLLVLVVVLIFGVGSLHDSPERVAEAFLRAIQRNNLDRMLSLTDPLETETYLDEDFELLKEYFDELLASLEIFSFAILEAEELSEDRVNVHYQLKYSYTDEYESYEEEVEDYFRLIQRDGKWYVQDFLH